MSELININEDLLDKNKSSSSQMTPTFTGDRSEERELLKGMGFEEDMINTIYKNMNPIDIQEAIDFLNKNERGQFTHSFLINENNVCTICGKGRNAHESDLVFVEDDNASPNDSLGGEDENNNFVGNNFKNYKCDHNFLAVVTITDLDMFRYRLCTRGLVYYIIYN